MPCGVAKKKRERENQIRTHTPERNKLKGKQSSVTNLADAFEQLYSAKHCVQCLIHTFYL